MARAAAESTYRTMATITPRVIRPGRSSLRTTFQLAADVPVSPGDSAEIVFAGVARVTMDWLDEKFPHALPKQARDLESFDLDHHGQQQLSGVSIVEDGLWSVRLVQPDAPFNDRPAVAGRTWTTEIVLHRSEAAVQFATRVLCASAPFATESITLTRPRIVVDIAKQFGLGELRPLDGRPWMLAVQHDLNQLHDLLIDPARTLPIVLLTQPDKRQWQMGIADYVLNQDLLARRLLGFAHVVCMPMALGFEWTQMVGKAWSAFHGAVRTYYPQANPDQDLPFVHPRVLPDRVLFWRYNGLEGEGAFASFLIDKLAEHAATKNVDWGKCIFFADARTRRAEVLRERIKREVEQQSKVENAAELRARIEALQGAHAEQVAALNAKIVEAEQYAREFYDLSSQYRQEVERYANENRSLQFQNDALRAAIETKIGSSADASIAIPDSYDDIPDWVEKNLAGRLLLHPRAAQGIKKAVYKEIGLVYQCLLLLAREYRDMRLAYKENAKKLWEDGLKRLGLRFGGSITRERAGEHGETYFVRYPLSTNQRQFLEFHLRKGTTKNDQMCLGIYFFWDEDTSQVIVGWLPSHLETRAS